MPQAITLISGIFSLLQQGVPVIEELYQALGIVRAAQSEGRDVTDAELDQIDQLRDQAVTKFDADVAGAFTGPAA